MRRIILQSLPTEFCRVCSKLYFTQDWRCTTKPRIISSLFSITFCDDIILAHQHSSPVTSKNFLRLRSGSYSKTDEWITAKEIRHKDSAILSPDGSINFLHWLPFQHSFVHHRVRSNRTMWWQDVFTLHLFILHCTRSSYRGHYNPLQNRGASRKPLQTKQLY